MKEVRLQFGYLQVRRHRSNVSLESEVLSSISAIPARVSKRLIQSRRVYSVSERNSGAFDARSLLIARQATQKTYF
jgi:hypothetical protein